MQKQKQMGVKLLTPGLYAGIRPKAGLTPPLPYDLQLFGGEESLNAPTEGASDGMRVMLPLPIKILPAAIQQNHMRIVLPCKGNADNVRYIKSVPSMMGGIYPQTGIGRHQPAGLATQADKPMNLPLMPLANTFYPALNNTLGQPK